MKTQVILLFVLIASNSLIAQTESVKIINDSITDEKYYLIDSLESKPEFPGELDSAFAFINRNNNWHVGQLTMTGRVFVSFIVEANGSISNIELVKKIQPVCDNEAIRIISIMPPWKPGKQNGKPVSTKLVLPILFDGL